MTHSTTSRLDPWDPRQYDKFRLEREQPAFDLISLVRPAPGMRVVDLGCGTGKPTLALHERLPNAETVGVDRSERMLESARALPLPPGLRFERGSIEGFSGREEYDLIFSNAAFHWVEDHPSLLRRLFAALKPGGQLAFQVPAMHHDASHTVAEALTSTEPFRSAFAGYRRPQPVLTPSEYARLLFASGASALHVRLVVYPHVLAEPGEVVEWMKGTLLAEYQRHLPADRPELLAAFVAAYRERLLTLVPDERPLFFPFERILCWARK